MPKREDSTDLTFVEKLRHLLQFRSEITHPPLLGNQPSATAIIYINCSQPMGRSLHEIYISGSQPMGRSLHELQVFLVR